jgi:uncharacterized protein YndB with AHSA1/START domain
MSIAPVIRSVDVKAPPARAFDLFTAHMERWWPVGRTVGKNPHAAIVMEPRPEGRWFERDAEGNETHWGKVLVWDPPARLVLGWQLTSQWAYDTNFLTEVELSFAPLDGGGTRVTLEHRNLERFGADAARMAEQIGGGWPRFLADFAAYADEHQN